jgi:Fur family ferric uptake transcriptional regulator
MTPESSLLDRMRSRGLRTTWQRRVVAESLEEADGHLDAETIFARARRKDARIHRATVYRTLNTLKRHGLVVELDLLRYGGDRHLYEVRPASFHIHLVCRECGRVQEPAGAFWAQLEDRVRAETGFRTEILRLEAGGVCAVCGRRGAAERMR